MVPPAYPTPVDASMAAAGKQHRKPVQSNYHQSVNQQYVVEVCRRHPLMHGFVVPVCEGTIVSGALRRPFLAHTYLFTYLDFIPKNHGFTCVGWTQHTEDLCEGV